MENVSAEIQNIANSDLIDNFYFASPRGVPIQKQADNTLSYQIEHDSRLIMV